MKRSSHLWVAGLSVAFTCWLAVVLLLRGAAPPVIRSIDWPSDAPWIEAPGDAQARGYFRLDFTLPPGEIARAWVAVAPEVGMELVVNGNPVGRWTAWRPTRPFQNGHSAYGQRATNKPPALALNFPREHQWSDHANWRLPIYLDLTPFLKDGQQNTLALRTESRDGSPSFALTGNIELASGENIPLRSNALWKASSRPLAGSERGWVLGRNPVSSWDSAREIPPLGTRLYSAVPQGTLSAPFEGHWSTAHQPPQNFRLPSAASADSPVWLRVLGSGAYLVKIDGKVVRPITGPGYHPAKGDWIAAPSSRRALAVPPELLDPAEAASFHSGTGFLMPAHGDPTDIDFQAAETGLDLTQDSLARAERGDLTRRATEDPTQRGAAALAANEGATARLPLALNRPQVSVHFSAFDISSYLHGDDAHTVELLPIEDFPTLYPVAQRYAWDLGIDLPTATPQIIATSEGGREAQPATALKFYRTEDPTTHPVLPLLAGGIGLALGLFLAATGRWNRSRPAILSVIAVTLTGIVFVAALGEKSEILPFLAHPAWRWALLALACLIALATAALPERKALLRNRRRTGSWLALAAILLLSFLLRTYGVDLQALDDDEYASVQATLSIAEKGVPELSPGIYYTRSPAYHYLAAGFIKLFGPHLWALRMPAILAGVASVFATYLLGSRLFHSRGIGLAAALLMAFHPFAIFTSHIARFYQQQQLFALLTLFFFVAGFVQRGAPWMRAATIICFGLGVLSQEISLVIVVPLMLCYALMARRHSWLSEFRLSWVSALVVGAVLLNLVAFKVICLTRLEGISPNAESTLKPHFWEPLNLFSMWIGYGRIHVFLAPFACLGIYAAFRNRVAGAMATTIFLLGGVGGIVFLVTGLGFRYQYALLPLWILLAVFGIREGTRVVAEQQGRTWQQGMAATLVLLTILAWCPWRILQSYDDRMLGDSSGATAFVRTHLRPGDKVAISEPHPHAALLEIGQVDYDLVVPILYDFVYRDPDGRLIDRNGAAEVMGRTAAVQAAMARHDRIWFLVNREKFRNRNRNHRWEYPGARLDFLIKQNAQLAYQGYLWDVYLWDRSRGHFAPFRQEPMAWNE